ncbi:hypothetical protein ACFL02_05125 [Planctomycetota bacterium]
MNAKNMSPEPEIPAQVFANKDERLLEKAAEVMEQRKQAGLEGLVGSLQGVIINTEPENQSQACQELLRYTGLELADAFEDDIHRTCVLRREGSADFLITARNGGDNPFTEFNNHPKTRHLPNTRLETFVFETADLQQYVEIQKARGIRFFTERIQQADDFLFIQMLPSSYTGNSLGFIQWRDRRSCYRTADSRTLDWRLEKPDGGYQQNIRQLDHAATRVRAKDRDPAILEFMALTNYNFQFAIYVDFLNSITNVSRRANKGFAMVFTSGVTDYIDDRQSGPTERFTHNYGPRVHHLAFHTENIEATFEALKQDDMDFLVELVGSEEEGLRQTFTVAMPSTMIVNEYIYRYGDFDGFFTKSNVAILTEATGKQ